MNERFARAGVIARVDLAHEPDFALGPVRVRPAQREICGEGWQEALEPRVMRLLVALVRAKGEILSRDDLIESCWDGVIVGEDAINRCISRLRKAAEATGNAFTIETIPRVGYRLKTADTAQRVAGSAPCVAEPIPALPVSNVTLPPRSGRTYMLFGLATLAIVTLMLVAAGYSLSWFAPRSRVTRSAPPGPEASVAVLPFVNLSGDPAKDYLSDGFSEELLNDLSGDPRLLVTARSSAFVFKGRNVDTQSVARTLHVRAIVEGSVREAGNRLRVTAQLIDAARGYNIWSASYDRDLSDILAVQGEVARNITIALAHKLVPGRTFSSGAIDPAVYRLLLQGRQQLDLISPDGYLKGYALLKQVTLRQPHFAGGFASFARAAWGCLDADPQHYDSLETETREAAAKALVLDPANIEAREMRALIEIEDWNWSAATADLRALHSESPNDMHVLSGLRLYYFWMGFWGASLETMQRAQALDPLSDTPRRLMLSVLAGKTYQFGKVIKLANSLLADEPHDPWILQNLCWAYAHTQQIGKADQVLRQLQKQDESNARYCTFAIAESTGDHATARAILEKWSSEFPDKFSAAQTIAGGFVAIGDYDKASDWYERAYDHHENFFGDTYLHFGPDGRSGIGYHQTARWIALTRRPAFKAWQAEHDRIASALAAHRDPLE